METPRSPVLPADQDAAVLARQLVAKSRHGALGVIHPDRSGTHGPVPYVSRVAVSVDGQGAPFLLLSAIALHTRALQANPALSLLLGDVGSKGDALTQPRLSIVGNAVKVGRLEQDHDQLHQLWRNQHKKAQIYMNLPDFQFFKVAVTSAFLNAGFGRAYELTPGQMLLE